MMDEFHLLENCRFAGLASAEEEHLDLILGRDTVTPELAFDLVIA